jgi:hypothetical protein
VHPRKICKWNLDDPTSFVVNSNKDLLKGVVTGSLELHFLDNVGPVKSEPAGHIGDRNTEAILEARVQHLAQQASEQRRLRSSALAITGRYYHVCLLPIDPEVLNELGIMGKICIKSDNVLAGRGLKSLL